MSAGRMHADEVDIDVGLVVRLLAAQFPQWAGLPVRPVPSAGTDNALEPAGLRRTRIPALLSILAVCGVGDPACDVMAAWMFLSAETRNVFRWALQVDQATWVRGRGWALSVGLIALPYYQTTNPVLAEIARTPQSQEALADYSASA